MEWFKHSTGSHHDPDISDAWDIFGDAGPTIFWTICEIFAAEYSHLQDGWMTISLIYFERELRRKWKKIEKILEFYQQRERIYFKKDQLTVSITIPKFIKIASNWTSRPKITPTEGDTEAPTEAPTAKEEKKKRREEKRKEERRKYLDSVFIADSEYQKLQEVLGQKNLDNGIEKLDYSITVKGGKYKDHYKTLLNWHKRGFLKPGGNGNGSGTTGSRQGAGQNPAIQGAKSDGRPYPVDGEY